jgi:hypothetical protein
MHMHMHGFLVGIFITHKLQLAIVFRWFTVNKARPVTYIQAVSDCRIGDRRQTEGMRATHVHML